MLSDRQPHATKSEHHSRLRSKASAAARERYNAESVHWRRGFDERLAGECALIPGDLHGQHDAAELWLGGWSAADKDLAAR
jgi:hypothetical protein